MDTEKLQKIKALMNSPVEGEAETARKLFQKLCKKYNYSEEEFVQKEEDFPFKLKLAGFDRKLFVQIAATVCGKGVNVFSYRNKPATFYIHTTKDKALEIHFMYEFYKKLLENEFDVFYEAFLNKHSLFPADGKSLTWEDLTKEDLQKIMRMKAMQEGMVNKKYKQTKLIEST